MDKISKEDALILENFALKQALLETQRSAFNADMRHRYSLADGDSVNPSTLEIVRATQPAPAVERAD